MIWLRRIGSWWLTAAFSLSLAAFYVYMSFGESPYQRWVQLVFHKPLGLMAYSLLVLNIAAASVRVMIDRLGGREATPETIRDMDVYLRLPGDTSPVAVAEWMGRRGFKPEPGGDVLMARKGGLCLIPGTVMRVGLVVFMAAFALSVHLRDSEEILMHEGEEASILGTEVRLERIGAGLPDEFLKVGERSALELKDVSAVLAVSGRTFEITPGLPDNSGGLYWRITHLGYSQQLEIDGSSLDADLDVLPPGRTHKLEFPESGISLSLTLNPEKTISKGLLTGRLYNLGAPSYRLALKRDGERHETLLRPTESADIGGTSLSLASESLYIRVNAVSDPALFWVYAGVVVALLGAFLMLTRFFWYERTMCAAFTDGEVLLGYSEEFYKRWGVLKFQRWRDELLSPPDPGVEKSEPSDADQQPPD